MNIYQSIYEKLNRLGIVALIEREEQYAKAESGAFMPLNYDMLILRFGETTDIALAHNYVVNGDVCCDPDMTIRVNPTRKIAEALSFQQSIPPLYQVVYGFGESDSPNRKIQKDLNEFLNQWLQNCIDQGFCFT